MNKWLYVTGTIGLYVFIVGIAMPLPRNISPVIDLLGTYAVSCSCFFIPSIFYTKALEKFKLKDPEDPKIKMDLLLCKIYLVLGIINAITSLFSAIMEAVEMFD